MTDLSYKQITSDIRDILSKNPETWPDLVVGILQNLTLQFYKNAPMALIVFVLMESSIFTKEYQSGTLVLALTKGLERYKVVVAKSFVLFVMWTIGYWLCFGITYLYNAYFWDNSIAKNLMFSVVCWWIFGLWVIALMVLSIPLLLKI